MNPLETFGEFSNRLTTTDLMLYAGAAVVLWVLFKEQLGGVTDFVKNLLKNNSGNNNSIITDNNTKKSNDEELFFELIASWKKTRDLAEKSGCSKAVESVDQMFPHLSPVVCKEKKDEAETLKK